MLKSPRDKSWEKPSPKRSPQENKKETRETEEAEDEAEAEVEGEKATTTGKGSQLTERSTSLRIKLRMKGGGVLLLRRRLWKGPQSRGSSRDKK